MWTRFCNRILYFFLRNRFDCEPAEEIETHRAMIEAEKIREGLSPEEAAINARRRLGNTALAGESSREIWSMGMHIVRSRGFSKVDAASTLAGFF
jgi:hypothetical protein